MLKKNKAEGLKHQISNFVINTILQQRLHSTLVEKVVFLIHSIGCSGYRNVKASFYQLLLLQYSILGADTNPEGKKHTPHNSFFHTHTHPLVLGTKVFTTALFIIVTENEPILMPIYSP